MKEYVITKEKMLKWKFCSVMAKGIVTFVDRDDRDDDLTVYCDKRTKMIMDDYSPKAYF